MKYFVWEESSWSSSKDVEETRRGIRRFVELAESVQGEACRHAEFLSVQVHDTPLFDKFYSERDFFDFDDVTRFQTVHDRTVVFDDSELEELDASVEGEVVYSPGVCWAHLQNKAGNRTSALSLYVEGVASGERDVKVKDSIQRIRFVTDRESIKHAYRKLILTSSAPQDDLPLLAAKAFPDLGWADNVWKTLGLLSKSVVELCEDLVKHLSVLDDYGAKTFREFLSTKPQEIGGRLTAHGAPCSDENGRTKQFPEAKLDRLCTFDGVEDVYWWHTKIRPDKDRIHFKYDAQRHRIIIGKFTEHAKLPT